MSLKKLREIEASLERIAAVEKYEMSKDEWLMSQDVLNKMSDEILKFLQKVERAHGNRNVTHIVAIEFKKDFFDMLEHRVKALKRTFIPPNQQ